VEGRQAAVDRGDAGLPWCVGDRGQVVPAGRSGGKGVGERANGYLETSYLPGRRFASPQDFNGQLARWLVRANGWVHRRLEARPVDRWEPAPGRDTVSAASATTGGMAGIAAAAA
jgi:hypothetical protein